MGIYLNPGSSRFQQSIGSEIYVDKTELIAFTNSRIGTEQKFLCVSRPRRFGKSMAAVMLAAYYSRDTDSRELFTPFAISAHPSFAQHLNHYNVLLLNIQDFLSSTRTIDEMLRLLQDRVLRELRGAYRDIIGDESDLVFALELVHNQTAIQFVILIDEWDCIFRIHREDAEIQKRYLDFLRLLLKDKAYVALAYMTGILPIKKYGSHSALNMFYEYSMTRPGALARFTGFTQDEVDALCARYGMDSAEIKSWYNGYRFKDLPAVYSPQSVVRAMLARQCDSYWTQTESYEALRAYINLNYDGLRDALVSLLADHKNVIEIDNFDNDMVTFRSYSDVLTLLVHLGYLGYEADSKEVFIPNQEIAAEYVRAMNAGGWDEIVRAVLASKRLLEALWAGDQQAVAAGIEAAHLETSHLTYNDENALAYTLSLAFFAAREYYTVVRELPTGKGCADLVFIPRPGHPEKPALIVELKWNHAAADALAQIHDRKYPAALQDYRGNLRLVGIAYDRDSRRHECRIEQLIR